MRSPRALLAAMSVAQQFPRLTIEPACADTSFSWNNADGVVRAHVDGLSGSEVFRIEGGPRGIGDTFLDKQSFLLLGLGCKLGLQAECDPKVSS